jgi:hypothetical protein
MFPEFFKHKLKEIGSFLKIVGGKVTRDKEQQIQGAESALEASDEIRQDYLDEKRSAEREKQPETGQEKVLRESCGQDISAI